MSELKNKAARGVKWTAVKSIADVILGPLTLTILARLLSPTEYGHIAIVTILIGFSKQIAAMGFSQAIIQRENVTKKDLDSIFWFEQLLGIITFLIIFFSANYISGFFNAPETYRLIQFSAFVFLLEPIDLVFRTLLKKDLRFDILTKSLLVRLILQKGTTVALAFLGFGAMSYIIGNLVGIVILTLIMSGIFLKNKMWFPSFYFSFSKLKPYLKFGVFIAGKSVFNNLFNYLDEIIIGGMLGTETLGIHHFAKKIISYLTKMINVPLTEVSFPMLSKLKTNLNSFNKAYINIIKLNALVSMPAHIGVAITASIFVPLFFGVEWHNAIPLISILAFWGMFKILYSGIISSAMYSFGNSNWIFYATVIDLPIRALLMYEASFYGIEMIAASLVLIAFVKFIIYQYLLGFVTEIKVKNILYDLKTVIFSSLIMTIFLAVFKYNLLQGLGNEFFLAAIILSGVIIYTVSFYLFDKKFVYYTLDLVKRMKG
ncbi:MAG: MOP flippase family protein [Nanoarchaeota archaeon]